ncbi:MAG: phiB5 09 [Solirubrobacterales bacterium]|nr:phiB5 09 [Solirubrobacterales bacterium]
MPAVLTVEPDTDRDQARRARQAERYAARHILWDESTLPRLRECGAVGVLPGGAVALKASGTCADGSRRGGFAGLSTCASTWCCPVCSAKIAAHRALELAAAVQTWHDKGGRVVMVTLTQRHDKGQTLLELWAANGYAWGAVTAGKAWQADKVTFGVHGWVRVVEVTHGAHGWHVHVHALVFLEPALGRRRVRRVLAADLKGLGACMFQRWRAALLRKGLAAPLAAHGGLDVRPVGPGDAVLLGDYFTKNTYQGGSVPTVDGVGREVAAGMQKKARQGNRTPFSILADVVAVGDAGDLELWHEWEKGSHNKRQMTWSQGLRAELLPDVELTDAEVLEDDQGGDVLAVIPAGEFAVVTGRRLDGTLIALMQDDDTGDAVRAFLTLEGIGWEWPPDMGESATDRVTKLG